MDNVEIQLAPQELLEQLSFCVFDLETTGGSHETDMIIEIGLAKIENLKIVGTKSFLLKPDIKIPEFIQKLTSIGPQDLKNAKRIEEVIDEILLFMGDSILVAHNTSFDIPFFNSVLVRLGRTPLTNRNLCTNLMTKYLIPGILNSNLNYMSRIFDIDHQQAHRALDDALATANLLLKYLHIFIDKNISKINHMYYPKNRYELDQVHLKNPCDLEKELQRIKGPNLITVKGENGIILCALPGKGTAAEKQFLLSIVGSMGSMPWEIITIKLYGSVWEALVAFHPYFIKMVADYRNPLMQFLWSAHLPNSSNADIPEVNTDPGITQFLGDDFGDFVISNHLIPEQYIIFPLKSLYSKSALIFRYPSHRKKLIQYVNAKSSRMNSDKLKRIFFPPVLRRFFAQYLIESRDTTKDIFVFKKHLILKKEKFFFENFEQFVKQQTPAYNYPRDYI